MYCVVNERARRARAGVMAIERVMRDAMDRGDWRFAESQVTRINTLMPDDDDPDDPRLFKYRVLINTELYNELALRPMLYYCRKCGPQKYEESQSGYRDCDQFERVVSPDHPYRVKTWTCPVCSLVHDVNDTLKRHKQFLKKPWFCGVVPDPPPYRNVGDMGGGPEFIIRMRSWMCKYYEEVCNALAAYFREEKIDFFGGGGEDDWGDESDG